MYIFSPQLRTRLGVDELGAHANRGTSLADASFEHVARAPFESRRRGARDDRQIPKPRKAGRDLFAEAVGERLRLRLTRKS